jgi:cbb3-type cytochrome oxidase subunit 1
MFLTGMLIMVYNVIQTIRSPSTALQPAVPAGLALAAE